MRAIPSLTWCKQRKWTLDLKHVDHTANFLHMCIRQIKVHQGAIRVCLGARDERRISINTDEFFLVFVGVVRSHQIPMILLGPSRWTVIPSGHHQHWATWVDIAEGTRCIVVLEIFVKRVKRQFVLSAIYQSSVLNAVLVLIVLWGLRFAAPPLWV